jgi:hypothetical protein
MLLLSAVASTIAFAGGDIAPVEPVVPAATPAPAACDFWGSIGARYEAHDDDTDTGEFGDKENNRFGLGVVLGTERELGYGFGVGAEVAALKAWSEIAEQNIYGQRIKNPNKVTSDEFAELSQLYLTYKYGNTAAKLGRQALPKSLSPWAWSDSDIGVLYNTFEGLVVANTDIADTTLVGAWIDRVGTGSDFTKITGDNTGLYMLAAQYTGIENTTLTGSVYFIPENDDLNMGKAVSVWGTAETKIDNFALGLQAAYAKADNGSIAKRRYKVNNQTVEVAGEDATFGVAAYAGTSYEGLNAKLTVAYINDGDATLNLGGTSAFWGNSFAGAFGGDVSPYGGKQTIVRLDADYNLDGYGTIYGGVAYDKYSDDRVIDKQYGGRLGYKFNLGKFDTKVEYRYVKTENNDGTDNKAQRIRVEGIYKF